MRLSKNEIDYLAFEIVKTLLNEKKIITLDREALVENIAKILTDDFAQEDKLDEEVREILNKYSEEIRKGNIEYQTIFRMIKQKLAKERKIVL
ncbi:MAG: DUF507 family protein [Candidatus Aminicenantia bacterium]